MNCLNRLSRYFSRDFTRPLLGLAAFGLATSTALTGCGESHSSKPYELPEEVSKVSDLEKCSASFEGAVVYVRGKKDFYICKSGEWVIATDDEIGNKNDSSKVDVPSVEADSTDLLPDELVKVEDISVSGYAQKGPYPTGTAVTVTILDKDFKKTSTVFKAKVEDDKGSFTVANISANTQFALVEVNGTFLSEISGKKTSRKQSLSALVDLSTATDKKLNVSLTLFSELETARALELIKNDGLNVAGAKKKASQELFNGLAGMVSKSYPEMASKVASIPADMKGEPVDLTVSGMPAAALYATNVLFLGGISAANFSDSLKKIEDSFAKDGKIFDPELTTTFADYASEAYFNGDQKKVAANIKALKISKTIPDYESILEAVWTTSYSLGACSEEMDEQNSKNVNRNSRFVNETYTCVSGKWIQPTEVEEKLGFCKSENQNETKTYKSEFMVCDNLKWRKLTEVETAFDICSGEVIGTYVNEGSKQNKDLGAYYCDEKDGWIEVDNISAKLKVICSSSVVDTIVESKDDSKFYFCAEDGWEEITAQEAEFGFCEKADSTNFVKSKNDGKFFFCSKSGWTEVDDITTRLGFCNDDTHGKVLQDDNTATDYVCVSDEWREATLEEVEFGLCSKKNEGKFSSRNKEEDLYNVFQCTDKSWVKYECDSKNLGSIVDENKICTKLGEEYRWREQNAEEIATGEYCSEALQDTVLNGYACVVDKDNPLLFKWRTATKLEKVADAVCRSEIGHARVNPEKSTWRTKNDSTVVCHRYTVNKVDSYVWALASEGDIAINVICDDENFHDIRSANSTAYICDVNSRTQIGHWRGYNDVELEMGNFCIESYFGTIRTRKSTGVSYTCDFWEWRESTEEEIATHTYCSTEEYFYFTAQELVCDKGTWRSPTTAEKATGYVCEEKMNNRYINEYVCQNKKWRTATAAEIATKRVCLDSLNNRVMNGYVCQNESWKAASAAEKATGFVCLDSLSYRVMEGYTCMNKSWRTATAQESAFGKACYSDIDNQFAWVNGKPYRCTYSSSAWNFQAYTYKTEVIQNDGTAKAYKIINIGDQTWMAENMLYEPSGLTVYSSNTMGWNADTSAKYGAYYPIETAQKVCPNSTGWYLPSFAEWKALYDYVRKTPGNHDSDIQKDLQVTTQPFGSNKGYDRFGFSAVPGGYYLIDRTKSPVQSYTSEKGSSESFWTSATNANGWPIYVAISIYANHSFGATLSDDPTNKTYARHVRCIKRK